MHYLKSIFSFLEATSYKIPKALLLISMAAYLNGIVKK
jgi:hypothetical protein